MTEKQFPENEQKDGQDAWPSEAPTTSEPFIPAAYAPENVEENVRRSGLAWSAGIVFFSSIAFMLFLGWIADLVFGISPWGLVGGIVLGSVIGFVQFFRITSQIFGSSKSKPSIRPLLSDDEDDK